MYPILPYLILSYFILSYLSDAYKFDRFDYNTFMWDEQTKNTNNINNHKQFQSVSTEYSEIVCSAAHQHGSNKFNIQVEG